ncbi:MAG: antitoxin VbhA family protein [Syntrophomonas sp.]
MDDKEAWEYAIGLIKVDGLVPSPELLELIEKEKRRGITTEDMIEILNEKYKNQSCHQKRERLSKRSSVEVD